MYGVLEDELVEEQRGWVKTLVRRFRDSKRVELKLLLSEHEGMAMCLSELAACFDRYVDLGKLELVEVIGVKYGRAEVQNSVALRRPRSGALIKADELESAKPWEDCRVLARWRRGDEALEIIEDRALNGLVGRSTPRDQD